ncbi:MAG: MFS transporter [Candidatus Bathyarchaeota archaeon]
MISCLFYLFHVPKKLKYVYVGLKVRTKLTHSGARPRPLRAFITNLSPFTINKIATPAISSSMNLFLRNLSVSKVITLDKSVYYLFIGIFPLMVCSGIIFSVFSLYIAEMGATEAVVGLVFAIGSVSGAFAGPLFGKLSDKFGRRSILLISMVIFAIAFLLYAVASDVLHISIIQGLEGVAWAAEGATAMALIADNVPSKERGQAMGMYNTVWNLGWVVGPILGGVLAQFIGFRMMFIICSVFILLGLALTLLLVKPHTRDENVKAEKL